jgi:hypothetical protein
VFLPLCVRRQIVDPESVAIGSTDAVIVVSYFLPVIVSRSKEAGPSPWTLVWDTENLLSLRTKLRVGGSPDAVVSSSSSRYR